MFEVAIVAAMLAGSSPAPAAQPADALKTCVADSTSGKDRKELARWTFLAIAAHPEMQKHANADAARAADDSSRAVADLVMRLLTESCREETKAVIKSGQVTQAMQLAFTGLGHLAMQELMTDASVQAAMGGFERYLDAERLAEALSAK